jgi:hypothetical protein
MTLAILWHSELKLADAADEGAAIIAGAIANPFRCAFALGGTTRIGHLGFEHLLHHVAHDLA